jgi:hypothetical protein
MEHDNENHLEGLGRLIAQAEVDSEDDAHEEEEDGNRVLFLDEDEDEDEDEEEDVDDEYSEANPNDENEESEGQSSAPEAVLANYFEGVQSKLSNEKRATDENRRETFWIEPPSPFFSLKGQVLDPASLYLPRVFVWRPHLRQELTCKECRSALSVKGWKAFC